MTSREAAAAPPRRTLLFTGHRVDAPGRAEPRFPPAAEGRARSMIAGAVTRLAGARPEAALGIAGGASGGDILFHEVCGELGVVTELYLALPRDEYVAASVEDGGGAWVERFDRLLAARRARYLSAAAEPGEEAAERSVWQRANLWMLADAHRRSGGDLVLLALWNGAGGDGPGGTADMVERARELGARVEILDARRLAAAALGGEAAQATHHV